MRNTIVNLIHEQAKLDKNVYFVTGDLGYSVVEKFMQEFPERCLNLGIAEQNLVGVAAGLALEGKKVFAYSIAPFITMRCMEQIRTDVALQNLDVTLIGIGGGFAYGTLGPTHYAIEDIAMLRAIPGMKVVGPSDPVSAQVLGKQLMQLAGPTYIRLNRGGEPALYNQPPAMEFGKGFVIQPGNDVAILSNGAITQVAIMAAQELQQSGISAEVVDMATIKPLDTELVRDRILTRKVVVTVEEHNIMGGFGSAVAEVVAESPRTAVFRRIGVNDIYPQVFGKQEYMREARGLSAAHIANTVRELYAGR